MKKFLKVVVLLGLLFVLGSQPLVMISSLIGAIIVFSGVVYFYMGDMWVGYLLLLVMLSGVMVVFTYMVSLNPNDSFEVSNMWFVIFMVLGFILMFGGDLVGKGNFYSFILWSEYLMVVTLFVIVFLFCLMVIVTWVSEVVSGAVYVILFGAWS